MSDMATRTADVKILAFSGISLFGLLAFNLEGDLPAGVAQHEREPPHCCSSSEDAELHFQNVQQKMDIAITTSQTERTTRTLSYWILTPTNYLIAESQIPPLNNVTRAAEARIICLPIRTRMCLYIPF